MIPDTILIKNVPESTTRDKLISMFDPDGSYSSFVLYPFMRDKKLAVVRYKNPKDLNEILIKKHVVSHSELIIRVLPAEIVQGCRVEISPHIRGWLGNIHHVKQRFHKEFGVDIILDDSSNKLHLESQSLLQIQCAQASLNSIYQHRLQKEEKHFAVGNIGSSNFNEGLESLLTTARSHREALEDLEVASVHSMENSSEDLSSRTDSWLQRNSRFAMAQPMSMSIGDEKDAPLKSLKKHTQARGSSLPISKRNVPDTILSKSESFGGGSFEKNPSNLLSWKASGNQTSRTSNGVTQEGISTVGSQTIDKFFQNKQKVSETSRVERTGMQTRKDKGRVVADVDAMVLKYLTMHHGQEVLDIEKNNGVKIRYENHGETTQIIFISINPKDVIKLNEEIARQHFIDAYQTIFFSIYQDGVQIDPEHPRKREFVKLIRRVQEDYKGSLIIELKSNSEVKVLGKPVYVDSAVQFIKSMMGVKAKIVSNIHQSTMKSTIQSKQSDAADTNRRADVGTNFLTQTDKGGATAMWHNFSTAEGVRVMIYPGDIVQETTDVIVNPANEDLRLLGGVSGAISSAGGPKVQRECTAYTVQHGRLKVANVMHTSGGRLISKAVIHVVSPMWILYKNKTKCQQDLTKCFLNCFIHASKFLNASSITVPCIGTGVFGVPIDECGQAFFYAVHIFSRHYSGSLKEIRIVSLDGEGPAVLGLIWTQLTDIGGHFNLPEIRDVQVEEFPASILRQSYLSQDDKKTHRGAAEESYGTENSSDKIIDIKSHESLSLGGKDEDVIQTNPFATKSIRKDDEYMMPGSRRLRDFDDENSNANGSSEHDLENTFEDGDAYPERDNPEPLPPSLGGTTMEVDALWSELQGKPSVDHDHVSDNDDIPISKRISTAERLIKSLDKSINQSNLAPKFDNSNMDTNGRESRMADLEDFLRDTNMHNAEKDDNNPDHQNRPGSAASIRSISSSSTITSTRPDRTKHRKSHENSSDISFPDDTAFQPISERMDRSLSSQNHRQSGDTYLSQAVDPQASQEFKQPINSIKDEITFDAKDPTDQEENDVMSPHSDRSSRLGFPNTSRSHGHNTSISQGHNTSRSHELNVSHNSNHSQKRGEFPNTSRSQRGEFPNTSRSQRDELPLSSRSHDIHTSRSHDLEVSHNSTHSQRGEDPNTSRSQSGEHPNTTRSQTDELPLSSRSHDIHTSKSHDLDVSHNSTHSQRGEHPNTSRSQRGELPLSSRSHDIHTSRSNELDTSHNNFESKVSEHNSISESITGEKQSKPVLLPQPVGGLMQFETDRRHTLPGFEDSQTINIMITFMAGIVDGISYDSLTTTAYLPSNIEGRSVLRSMKSAFDKRRMFVIKVLTPDKGMLVANGVPLKVNREGGRQRNGYPDKSYLDEVTQAVASILQD